MHLFYPDHSTELTPALWAAYSENCIKTEPNAVQLLSNFGVLNLNEIGRAQALEISGPRLERLKWTVAQAPATAVQNEEWLVCSLDYSAMHSTHRLQHAFIGIATELFELERLAGSEPGAEHAGFMEESGDLCWYAGLALDTFGCSTAEVFERYVQTCSAELDDLPYRSFQHFFQKALGQFKRFKFYGKVALEEEVKLLLVAGLIALERECTAREIQFRDILQGNSWKLLGKRYASGAYSNEQALGRKDKDAATDDVKDLPLPGNAAKTDLEG